ncbi:C39 family peptidase [Luteimonas sp. MC1825]|uniref:C39 family peptidase n=1 Tax=Luteimonas sp. MC1825 TaxID=2761107 RepID=UPI001CC5DBAE|nr:C39 family peptidase [Luteimonas sp. MC1825]
MTPRLAAPCLVLAVAGLLQAAAPCGASGSPAEIRVPNGGSYAIRVTSLKEARYRTTIRQQYDFSCGSAAVATLLTYQYGQPVGEADVFKAMYARGDQARIRREGFSLLDMREYLQARGYEADGFELPLDKLLEEGLPAIILINDRGYRHFVVVKGMRDGRVLLGDPARGTRLLKRGDLERLWDNRVLFVVHNRRELAAFNASRDWRAAPLAPIALAVQRQGLQDVVLSRRGPGDI